MVVPGAFDLLKEEKAMTRSRTAASAGGSLTSGEPAVAVGTGPLTSEDVLAVARHGAKAELAPQAMDAIRHGREIIDALIGDTEPHYGGRPGSAHWPPCTSRSNRARSCSQVPLSSISTASRSEHRPESVSAGRLSRSA